MNKRVFYFIIPLGIGLIIGLLLAVRLDILPNLQSQDTKTEAMKDITYPGTSGLDIEDAVINVANTTGKAVVSISTEHTGRSAGVKRFYFGTPFEGSPFEDDFFRRFFEDFFGELPEQEYKRMGLGSGVIIDPEGYILTNEHVISGADKITVKLSDGREFRAQIKGKDVRSDLAVIKVDAKSLPVAKLGDSDDARIGQWVVAIGNPFGFALQNPEPTVTVGVISALHRSLGRLLQRDRDYNDLIQTDAAINPGNSGGSLVNLKGEIVGINVAIFSTTGGYQGVGFAIPINSAKRILSRLIAGKKILYGWLGIKVQDLDENLARHFGRPDKNGVLVAEVMKDSPAEKAGIKNGDVIVKFSDQKIDNVKMLLNIVGSAEVGKRVQVELFRDKRKIALMVEIGERPEEIEEISKESSAQLWRGLEVQDITSELMQRLRLKNREGVVVTFVESGSPADEAGIMVGDIILGIDKQPVKDVSDYQRITRGMKADALVRTQRGYFILKSD